MDREARVHGLRDGPFDLLVVGGGSTGCGVAVDAASRGLKVALVEKGDFGEGTSSRSTKLIHGGVRYLEKAVRQFDGAQLSLVREGLRERHILLRIAPHLVHPVYLLTPLYRRPQALYVWLGLKLYDLLAGKRHIAKSELLDSAAVAEMFPQLDTRGLRGGVRYADGQFSDVRMIVALVQTATRAGANCVNHVEVVGFDKEGDAITGANVRDRLSGESWTVHARGFVNATGPFADRVRRLDNPDALSLVTASTGVHIVLDKRFSPAGTGMLIPRTEDGRVLFAIPWENYVLVGSTDDSAEVSEHPPVSEAEIDYLLRHLGCYLGTPPTRADVKSAWSGLRPLVTQPGYGDTQNLVRDHRIVVADSGLLTVVGGKWTSYRRMARQTVDRAVQQFELAPAGPCVTDRLVLEGSQNLRPDGAEQLALEWGLAPDIAVHLHGAYGDRAEAVARLMAEGYGVRLVEGHPYVEAEVLHAVREESARRAMDVLCRRIPLALLDLAVAKQAASRVIGLMAAALCWGDERLAEERSLVRQRLQEAL